MTTSPSFRGTIPAAQSQAEALFELLGGRVYGVEQRTEGSYDGERRELTLDDLVRHFSDEATFAIKTVVGRKTRLMTFDCDRHFPNRMRILAAELRNRRLDAATICTTGSDDHRGKVLTFFRQPQGQRTLNRLACEIRDAASKHPSWGIASADAFSIFPQSGEGGLVRVAGRNRHPARRALSVDRFFSLDGEPIGFAQVVPAIRFRPDPEPVRTARLQSWVFECVAEPWTRQNGSKANYARFLRLAGEAARVYGAPGEDVLRKWAEQIWSNSPDLKLPSPSTGDARSRRTFNRWRVNAWKRQSQRPHLKQYIVPAGGRDIVSFLGKCESTIKVLFECSEKLGVAPDAIGISTRRLAELQGVSPATALRRIRHLEKIGRAVVIDPGVRNVKYKAAMIVGLVPIGESADEVRKRAETRGNVKKRRHLRASMARGASAQPIVQRKAS